LGLSQGHRDTPKRECPRYELYPKGLTLVISIANLYLLSIAKLSTRQDLEHRKKLVQMRRDSRPLTPKLENVLIEKSDNK